MLINLPPYSQNASNAVLGVGDPLWDKVALLMHMEAANGSTALLDERGHVNTGNVKASNVKKKFGNTSARHEGVGSIIQFENTVDFDLLAKDFCVEAWVNIESTWRGGTILGRWSIGGGHGSDYIFNFYGNGAVEVAGVASFSTPAGSLPLDNNWHHIAIDRFGSTVYVFVNGVIKGSAPGGTAANSRGRALRTGMWDDTGSGWIGYMDELRFTNGVSRYRGSAFAPPTAAFHHKRPQALPLGGTWDAAGYSTAAAYSNDNNTAALSANRFTTSTARMSSGVYYFETRVDAWTRAYAPAMGIVPEDEIGYAYQAPHGRCVWGYDGALMGDNGTVLSRHPELVLAVNDRLGVLVDFISSNVSFYKNGAAVASTTFDSTRTYCALASSTAGTSPATVTLLPNAAF